MNPMSSGGGSRRSTNYLCQKCAEKPLLVYALAWKPRKRKERK